MLWWMSFIGMLQHGDNALHLRYGVIGVRTQPDRSFPHAADDSRGFQTPKGVAHVLGRYADDSSGVRASGRDHPGSGPLGPRQNRRPQPSEVGSDPLDPQFEE